MRRWILPILTAITFTLAAPVLVQEKREACVDVVHVSEDVITVLRKRILDEDLNVLWDDLWHYENVWGEPAQNMPLPNLAEMQFQEVHVPPPSPADSILGLTESGDDASRESSESGHSHSTQTIPADSERESVELDDDGPPGSSESGHSRHSHSQLTSPESSTKSEDWYTAPTSLGSSTESTISNAPNAESLSENLKAADYELKGKAKVSRRISGIANNGVDTVNAGAADMELRSTVDPRPFPQN
ncbi:hypothetical protein F5888DRAFT_858664 [Russula emetica]|nr:hypothetical protein F5888DRAFT_858664 [Russula emetica]